MLYDENSFLRLTIDWAERTIGWFQQPIECLAWSEGLFISNRPSHKFVSASYRVGDSEFDHLWGGRSGEKSMMLRDPKLPNDPED